MEMELLCLTSSGDETTQAANWPPVALRIAFPEITKKNRSVPLFPQQRYDYKSIRPRPTKAKKSNLTPLSSFARLTSLSLMFIVNRFSASGVGASSNLATVLVPIALLSLTLVRWIGQKLTEVPMRHKSSVKRLKLTARKSTAYLLETIWAVGASVVATMVSPLPTL